MLEKAVDKVLEIHNQLDELLNILQSNPSPEPIKKSRKIGLNIGRPTYWDHSIIYSDALKHVGMVTGYSKQDEQNIPVDVKGRPAFSIPFSSLKLGGTVGIYGSFPVVENGEFNLVLDGKCKIRFPHAGTFTESTKISFPTNLEKENFIIEEAEVGSNWQLFYPDQPTDSLFHSSFLNDLNRISCIRGMDWTLTNSSKHINWIDRRLPNDLGQSSTYGACWEHLIELSNVLSCDLWICIPHNATDDYIRKLSILLKEKLNPGVNLFVEYSNEVWNSARAFRGQYSKAVDLGNDVFSSENNYFNRLASAYGHLANKAYKTFDENWSIGEVNYVCAWQASANFSHRAAIEQCGRATHLSLAPYLWLPKWQDDDSLDVTINRIKTEAMDRSANQILNYKKLATEYNLELASYECGFHVVGGPNEQKSYDLSRRPEYEDILVEYDDMWNDLTDNSLRCYFTYQGKPRDGNTFGLQDYAGDTENPKWKGFRRLVGN